MSFKFHIICFFLFIGVSTSYGQETREDIERKANTYFEEKNFLEATPLYLRLLSLDPRDHNYNYRYGTCLLFNSKKKQSAFKYLQFAVKGASVDDEAFYYLGKAYHLTYQFKKAITNYEKYMDKAGSRALKNLDVGRQIEMCRNGLSLLSKLSETIVLSKQQIDISDFFRIYDLSNIGGEIIVTEAFQNRQDKRNNHLPIIHFPSNTNRIFYSSYGNSGDHKDIYTRKRLPDGSWSLEQKVKGEINTEYDEDFPYLHPNGRYLYFSSKGHNSMGGFDIFRSKYDPENDDFGKPVNLDFAISSADDDFLYVVDSLNKNAYFASTRESESEKVDVYNVRVERFPVQIAIIKGTFSSTIDPTNKDLSIRIANANTGEKIGDFETSQKGDYLLTLPKGGNYEFTLRVGGKDTDYKQVIEVPYLREFRPLKQKIVETIQNEQEIVLVSNKFDEEFDDPVAIMTEVIKQQSSMEVNKDSYDLDSLDKMKAQREVLAELGLENFSNLEILQLADDKVDNLTQRLETSQNKVLKAQKTIENSKKVIAEAYKRADSLSQLAEESSDPEKASNFHRRANQALQTVKNQQRVIENAEVLESFLTKDIVATEKKLKPAIAFKKKLNAVDRDDDSAFLGVVNDNKKYIADVLLTETLIDAQFEYMDEIETKLVKAEEQKSRIAQLKEQREQLQNEIAALEDEVKNAKRRKKESLQMELDAKKNQLSDLDNETNYLENQVAESEKLQEQKDIVTLVDKTDVPEDYKPSTDNESDYDNEKIAKLIKSNDEAVEKIDAKSNSEMPQNIQSILNEINSLTDSYTAGNISEQELLSEKKEQLNKLKEKRTNLDEDLISEEQTKYLDEFIELQEKEIDKIEEKIKIRNSSAASDLTVDEKQVLIDQLNEEITELSDQETDNQTKVDARKELVQELEKEIENAEENSSDVDEDLTSQEKDEIIASVNPDYDASVNELKQQAETDSKAQDELLEKQKSFVEELETAINETNEAINNGENPTENKRKKEVLEEKKSQVEREIAELEKKRGSDTTTDDLAVSDSEKAVIIADADKKYTDDINQIQEDIDAGLATDEDLIERKEKHKEELQKALDKTSKKLERNPEDEELQKENKVLTEAIQEISEEIDQLKETTTPLSQREKDEIIASVNPDYDASINELKQQAENDPKAQEELIEKQKSFVEELEMAINETNEAINNGENPTENKRKKEVLEEKKSQVEREIAELENKRDSDTTDVLAVSDSEKAAIIADADKKYTDDISQLQEDIDAGLATDEDLIQRKEKHKEALQKELDKTSKKLERNPEDEELQKENQVLTEAIQEVSEEIDQLKETTTPLSESEKDEIIASVDPDFDASVNELKQQAETDSKAQDELLEKQKSFVKELETAINEANEAINNGENITENKRKKAVLEEKKSQVEREIAELEKKRGSDTTTDDLAVSDSEKAAIIADADKKYTDDISQLQEDIDAGLATDEDLIQRKEKHKEALQKELDKTSKKLERNPEDEELQKENQVLTEAIQEVSEEIDQLKETTTPLSQREKDEIIASVNPDFDASINELKQAENNPKAQEELLEKQKSFVEELETAINETNEAINNGENPTENKRKKEVLEEKKSQVEREIAELEKKRGSDTTTDDLAVSDSEKAAIIADADKKYIDDINQIQEEINAGLATDEDLIERKEKHKEELQKALDKTSKKLERNPEDEELQKENQVLTEAIQEVSEEIDQLKETTTPISQREKDEIIASVNPDYDASINELKQQAENDPKAQEELIEKQKSFVEELEMAINETNEAINNGENPTENKRKKEVLEEKKSQVEREIAELENKRDSDTTDVLAVSDSEKAAIIADADKKYTDDISQLQEDIDAGLATDEDLIERKKKHKEELQKALDKTSKKLERNPEDEELQKENQVLTEAIQEVSEEIDQLNVKQQDSILASISDEEKEKVLSKAGGQARIEIGELEQQAKINPAKKPALLEAKKTYLKSLESALVEAEQKLEKNPNDQDSSKEVAILNEEKRKVKIEIGELEKETISDSDYPELADQSLSKASDLTSEELKALEQPTKEIKNLNNQLSALEKIESRLLQMRNDSPDEQEIKAIDKKINQIREKSRSVLISIGEVSQEEETIARAVTENKEEFSERELKQVEKSVSTISDLEKKKEDLLDEKATTDSERAKKRVQKKIDKATDKITKEEVAILEKTTEKSNEQLNKQLIEEDLAENTEVDGIGSRKSFNEAEQLLSEAENTKNPEEKKALLVEAQQKQQEAIAQNNDEKRKRRAKILIGDVTKEMGLSNIDPETVSNTKSSIETEQQTIGIKIQEIDEEIDAIEAKISLAKKKDLEELNERKLAFLALKKMLAKKFESNELALQEINAQEIADKNDGLSNSALTEKISYEEEVSFAQREEYDELYQISQRLDSKNTEINQKTSELNGLKSELNQLTENIDIDEEANDSKGKAVKSLLTNINETEEELKKLRDASEKEERKLKEKLPTDAKERKIAENLIKRNVTPIEKAPSLPVMSTGIVLTDAKQTYSDENPIPLKPKTPGGLVFRVQIGAFSKPVPNNTFNDFTPVTGEQVRPGLIRYMAGFFPSRDNATEARDKIRGLGYSDAFVVAYCDGERIPVYRAQQLLASGACVPTISSPEKPVYTETEATEEDFDPNTSFEEELDVFAYNKAPGAAEADVAEKIMGLYYTVQVGVYNKPVSTSQLKNISPLITKRLENGQMRYSSGIFDNVPDARVKRSEAIELGITDAYIVAYFKGERISVSQAQKLIEENGETILESNNPTVVKRNKVSSNSPDVRPEPEPYLKDKSLRVQLESKDNFVLYPTNELNTYNQTDALFYYDKESSTIKSFLYEKDAMPSLKGLENQFSKRLYYNGYKVTDLDAETKSNALSEAEQTKAVLTAKIQFTDLNDELFNFIQKASFLKHIKVQESGIIVTFISNKDDENIKDAQIQLARFGATELELTEQELAPND